MSNIQINANYQERLANRLEVDTEISLLCCPQSTSKHKPPNISLELLVGRDVRCSNHEFKKGDIGLAIRFWFASSELETNYEQKYEDLKGRLVYGSRVNHVWRSKASKKLGFTTNPYANYYKTTIKVREEFFEINFQSDSSSDELTLQLQFEHVIPIQFLDTIRVRSCSHEYRVLEINHRDHPIYCHQTMTNGNLEFVRCKIYKSDYKRFRNPIKRMVDAIKNLGNWNSIDLLDKLISGNSTFQVCYSDPNQETEFCRRKDLTNRVPKFFKNFPRSPHPIEFVFQFYYKNGDSNPWKIDGTLMRNCDNLLHSWYQFYLH